MTTSAKSVHEFLQDENSFFGPFPTVDEPLGDLSAHASNGSMVFSPLSVESVSLSPNEENSPDIPLNMPEKRKNSGFDGDSPMIDGDYLDGKMSVSSASSHHPKSAKADKPESKRSGRKLTPAEEVGDEHESRRKAQNRAAQRAFRERKEQHLKELEDRVKHLESEASATTSENRFLKLQVEGLQSELKRYRQTKGAPSGGAGKNTLLVKQELGASSTVGSTRPFTFEFPFFTGNESKTPASATSTKSPSTHASISSVSSKSSNDSSFSPVSSVASSITSPAEERRRSSGISESKPEDFCDQLSMACGTRDHPLPKAQGPGSTLVAGSPPVISAGSIPWNSSASPQNAGLTAGTTVASNTPASTVATFSPSEFDIDFISEYRGPLFEGDQFTLPELATSDYSIFDPIENPIANTTFEMLNKTSGLPNTIGAPPVVASGDDDDTVPEPAKLMSCTAVWDRICQHPKFGDIDIDGLCSELRSKAKCSESGVLLTENDVDNVLSALS